MADIASPLALARQAIAAAKTAVDEGEAILRRTQECYRLKLHRGEAQAERPHLAKPKLIIKPELPEYVLSTADRVNVAAVVVMMKTAHAAKSEGLRKAAYRDLSLHLQDRSIDDQLEPCRLHDRQFARARNRPSSTIAGLADRSDRTCSAAPDEVWDRRNRGPFLTSRAA
jgi:hypothetical protein